VAERLCNKVAIIKAGDVLASGNMADIVREGQSLEDIFMEAIGRNVAD
jgi:ABC-2 type transport system ATP-binding protein